VIGMASAFRCFCLSGILSPLLSVVYAFLLPSSLPPLAIVAGMVFVLQVDWSGIGHVVSGRARASSPPFPPSVNFLFFPPLFFSFFFSSLRQALPEVTRSEARNH